MPRPGHDQKHIQDSEIGRRLKDLAGITAALKEAAQDAVQAHARAGQKIVVGRDNMIVWEDPNGAAIVQKADTHG